MARNTRKWHQAIRSCAQSMHSQLSSWAMEQSLPALPSNIDANSIMLAIYPVLVEEEA